MPPVPFPPIPTPLSDRRAAPPCSNPAPRRAAGTGALPGLQVVRRALGQGLPPARQSGGPEVDLDDQPRSERRPMRTFCLSPLSPQPAERTRCRRHLRNGCACKTKHLTESPFRHLPPHSRLSMLSGIALRRPQPTVAGPAPQVKWPAVWPAVLQVQRPTGPLCSPPATGTAELALCWITQSRYRKTLNSSKQKLISKTSQIEIRGRGQFADLHISILGSVLPVRSRLAPFQTFSFSSRRVMIMSRVLPK